MNKFMNGLCLGIWIFEFVFGIAAAFGKVTVSPIAFICAVLICILHYIEKMFNT